MVQKHGTALAMPLRSGRNLSTSPLRSGGLRLFFGTTEWSGESHSPGGFGANRISGAACILETLAKYIPEATGLIGPKQWGG
jgi:hypothetical protein